MQSVRPLPIEDNPQPVSNVIDLAEALARRRRPVTWRVHVLDVRMPPGCDYAYIPFHEGEAYILVNRRLFGAARRRAIREALAGIGSL